jgi:RNA polymerase sigma-70 factor (ECF subfamily)
MSEPRALVEHFFRHEFGRLCAVLTRLLGVRRLDLVKDVVQASLEKALEPGLGAACLKTPTALSCAPIRHASQHGVEIQERFRRMILPPVQLLTCGESPLPCTRLEHCFAVVSNPGRDALA